MQLNTPAPTGEQAAILDAARGGSDLVLDAGAGCGKTTALRMLAADRPRLRMLYLAYNKAIAAEAGQVFGRNVTCRTAHSVAFGAVGRRYSHRLNGPRMPGAETARRLDVTAPLELGSGVPAVRPKHVGRLVMATVERFCHSADPVINTGHVPAVAGYPEDTLTQLRSAVGELAAQAWADLTAVDGELRFTHDVYLKLWQLSGPRLGYDVVMLDEAQDADPAIADVIDAQQHTQRVAVGDRCQPAGTLVSVVREQARNGPGRGRPTVVEQVPIEQIRRGDRVVSFDLSKAFLRRSGSRVSGITERSFSGNLVRITAETGATSAYTPDHHCVARVAPALAGKYALYLMRRGGNYRVGITTGINTNQGNRPGFMIRAHGENADAVWILDTFDTRNDAAVAEVLASWGHGVPELTFQASNHSVFTQEQLDGIWAKIGANRNQAASLLATYGRDIDYPLWERGGSGMLVRRSSVVRACNLLDGMTVLTRSGAMDANGKRAVRNLWTSVLVSHEPYCGPVYSMTVERDHTYVGDDIVTHNCQSLYGWRGAIDAMSGWDWDRLWLTQSFRFGPRIAEHANRWLTRLGTELRLAGSPGIDSRIGVVAEPDAILCRTNAGTVAAAIDELAAERTVAIVGGVEAMVSLARAAIELRAGRGTDHPELFAFTDWEQLREYATEDPAGSDLRPFVRLIDTHGPHAVIKLEGVLCRREDQAQVIVSTAHKAKGREWPTVRIYQDFTPPAQPDDPAGAVEIPRADAMLAYVAVTRARQVLDTGSLCWGESPPWRDAPCPPPPVPATPRRRPAEAVIDPHTWLLGTPA